MIARFFHRLFHYHCEECIQEEHERKNCTSCETLKQQLAQVNAEKSALLNLIVKQHEPVSESKGQGEPVQLSSRHVPWAVKRQMLEQADREKAEVLRKHAIQTTEDLEKELGVDSAT